MFGRFGLLGLVAFGLFVYMTGPDSGAASALVTSTCRGARDGHAIVRLEWKRPGGEALQSWLDVSLTEEFVPGQYAAHGPLLADQHVYTLGELPLGLRLHYRVNTLAGEKWRVTSKGSFVVDCARPPIAGEVTQACAGDGTVAVTFRWEPRAPGSQHVDITTHAEGFAADAYASQGPVAEGADTHTWEGMTQGIRYRWRVRVETPEGPMTSEPRELVVRGC